MRMTRRDLFRCLSAQSALVLVPPQAPSAQPAGTFANSKVTHVGVIVRDIEKSAQQYAAVLGIPAPKINESAPIPYAKDYPADPQGRSKYVTFPLGQGMMIELQEPVGGASPWRNHLDKHGEGLSHIALSFPDVDQGLRTLQAKGGKIEFVRPGRVGYINFDSQLGITFEVTQAPNETSK